MARARSEPSRGARPGDQRAPDAQTIERARRLEQGRYEPNWYTRRDRFWAVLAHTRDASLDAVLGAVLSFARPRLGQAAYADQLWAWTVAIDEIRVAFLGSIPDLRDDGEYLVHPLDLPRYLMVEHNVRPGYDRLLEYDGDEIRICSRDGNDFEAELPRPFAKGHRVDQTGPWRLLERRTGMGLRTLRRAMTSTSRAWLVLDGVVVLPGADGSRRKPRRARPPAPAR